MMQIRLGLCLLLASVFWAFGAMAQPTGLYAVKNVTSDDSLNVRKGAGTGFKDIGDIAYDGFTRVIGFSNDGKWAEVPWVVDTAWVAARFLRLVQADRVQQSFAIPKSFECGGTEPFWSADVSNDAVSFQLMDAPMVKAAVNWSEPALGRPTEIIIGFGAGDFTGVLRRQACSDGMSEDDYPWSIVLTSISDNGLRVMEGCCSF